MSPQRRKEDQESTVKIKLWQLITGIVGLGILIISWQVRVNETQDTRIDSKVSASRYSADQQKLCADIATIQTDIKTILRRLPGGHLTAEERP